MQLELTQKMSSLIEKEGLSKFIQDSALNSVIQEPKFLGKFKNNSIRVFVDVDGVLADFQGSYMLVSGEPFPKDNELDSKVTSRFEFWADMPWLKGGKELWALLEPLKPTLLTAAVQLDEPCREGRTAWVKSNLADDQEVIFESVKGRYADSRSVLIDDAEKNIQEFEDEGGIGILYKGNPTEAVRELYRKVMDLK